MLLMSKSLLFDQKIKTLFYLWFHVLTIGSAWRIYRFFIMLWPYMFKASHANSNSGYYWFAKKKKKRTETRKKRPKNWDNTAININVLASLIQRNNIECKMFTFNKKLFALAHSLSLCLNLSQWNILTLCFPKT